MKRVLKYSLVATPLVLGLFALFAWLTPAGDLSAAEGCDPCDPTLEFTPVVTSSPSASCQAAENDAKTKAYLLVDCGSDSLVPCSPGTPEIVTPCQGGPPFTAQARIKFRCRFCEPIVP